MAIGERMKKIFSLVAVLVLLGSFAGLLLHAQEHAKWMIFLDAGVPIKEAEGRYGADFGKSFLGLATQARLAGNFYAECDFVYFFEPRPDDTYFYDSDGFEFALDAVWKFAPMKKISPFVKIGLSYGWIISNNSWREIYYPDAGRETSRWLGLNAGGGIDYRFSGTLLLRLGGIFTLVPSDGEGAVASWGKIFIGIGTRI
jgi:hypothetical protein